MGYEEDDRDRGGGLFGGGAGWCGGKFGVEDWSYARGSGESWGCAEWDAAKGDCETSSQTDSHAIAYADANCLGVSGMATHHSRGSHAIAYADANSRTSTSSASTASQGRAVG